jgi:hypothetical protein
MITGAGGVSAAAPASHTPSAAWACSSPALANVFIHFLHSRVPARLSVSRVLAAPRPTTAGPPAMDTALVDLICLLVTLVAIAALRQHQFPK